MPVTSWLPKTKPDYENAGIQILRRARRADRDQRAAEQYVIDEYNKLKTRRAKRHWRNTVLSTASFRRLFFIHSNSLYWLLPTQSYYQNEKIIALMLFLTFFAHANDSELAASI